MMVAHIRKFTENQWFVYLQWVNLYNINYVLIKQWGGKQQGVGSRELQMNQDWQYVDHSCKQPLSNDSHYTTPLVFTSEIRNTDVHKYQYASCS